MNRYVKKPIAIEAVKWKGFNGDKTSVVWNFTINNNLNPSDLFDPDLIVSDFKLREWQPKRLVVMFIFIIRST